MQQLLSACWGRRASQPAHAAWLPAQPPPTADSQSAVKSCDAEWASALEDHASAVAGGNAGVVVGAEALPCPGADGRIDVGTPTARQGRGVSGQAGRPPVGGRGR
jgi:hypothetical protein